MKKDGKKICDVLKEIRANIAKENGLELSQSECTFKGECNGTCPRCDKELEEINQKVDTKKLLTMGTITLSAFGLSACGTDMVDELSGDISYVEYTSNVEDEVQEDASIDGETNEANSEISTSIEDNMENGGIVDEQ